MYIMCVCVCVIYWTKAWYVETLYKVTGDRNTILKERSLLDETDILKTRFPPPTHSSSSSPQQQQFHLTTNQTDHCRPHPSAKPTADHTPHPGKGNIQRYPTTQSICSSVHVYTPSWWKMNASRYIEFPVTRSCSQMRACRSTEKTSTRQGWVWFQTKCVGQRQCATRCMQNSRRANPVSSRLSHPGID